MKSKDEVCEAQILQSWVCSNGWFPGKSFCSVCLWVGIFSICFWLCFSSFEKSVSCHRYGPCHLALSSTKNLSLLNFIIEWMAISSQYGAEVRVFMCKMWNWKAAVCYWVIKGQITGSWKLFRSCVMHTRYDYRTACQNACVVLTIPGQVPWSSAPLVHSLTNLQPTFRFLLNRI